MVKHECKEEGCGKSFHNNRALLTHMTWHTKPTGVRQPRTSNLSAEFKILGLANMIRDLLPVGLSITVEGKRIDKRRK